MIKKTALSLLVGMLMSTLIFGQGETSNWYFGNNAGIQFNSNGTVTPISDGRLDTFEGCTTISNEQGDLLFYTDGITVFDRNHNTMQNGARLYGDPSSTQSALIVPKPLDPNIYYIFTVDTSTFEGDPDRGLNYSTVDISLNNGNGAVIEKNVRLLNDCSEKVAAVLKNCSDKSVWVVTLSSEFGSGNYGTYHAFEVNATGVTATAVKSTFPNLSIEDARGYLKFSNDGKKMASANMRFGLQLFDFDALTGIVSNKQELPINGTNQNPYGIEFSPNSRFLYTHSSNFVEGELKHASSLIQFDLSDPDIVASQVEIEHNRIYRGALQLGANGKIYRTIAQNYFTGTPYLGVINNPNEKGLAANYQHNAIRLTNNSTQGLPPFIQSFFNKRDLILNADGSTSASTTLCIGESFTLEAEEIPGATYLWEKDGNPIVNPDGHLFNIDTAVAIDAGQYGLEIILPNPNECHIFGESLIEVLDLPESMTLSLVQCDVDSDPLDGLTSFNLQQSQPKAEYTYLFYESAVDQTNDIRINTILDYRNTQPFNQTIYYTVINEGGCENYGELQLQVQPVDFNNNQLTLYSCDEDISDGILAASFDLQQLALSNFPADDVVFYKDLDDLAKERDPLSNIEFSESKTIYGRVENANQCQNVLEITLVVNPSPIVELEPIYELCTDDPFLPIEGPNGFGTYHWVKNDGNGSQTISNSQTVSITEIGDYTLEVAYIYDNGGIMELCSRSTDFKVIPSNRAVIENIIIQDFSANNSVLVEVSGDGDYEFSLDGVDFKNSSFFENVAPGFARIRIRDKKGCGIIEQLITVLGYPKFFTPNGDGMNEHWNLIGLSKEVQANSSISIFDRYGKRIARIGPDDLGWNGTFNAKPVPSSDYWFKATLNDGRIYKGHFALKR